MPFEKGLRQQLAATAARLIAEDGLDYGAAKRKAAHALVGARARIPGDQMPDNDEVENALREYQQLFQAEFQPQRLHHLRQLALELMQLLQPFNPCLSGAVWNGTAGTHSPIRLELFTDSGKDVAIFLLNQGLVAEAGLVSGARGDTETLAVHWHNEAALLFIYATHALRHSDKKNGAAQKRGNIDAVRRLLEETDR